MNDLNTTQTPQDGPIDSFNEFLFLHSKLGPESDKKWFLNHPDRNYRMRWATSDESSGRLPSDVPKTCFLAVITHQVVPGGRVRIRLYWDGKLPSSEEKIAEIYDWHAKELKRANEEGINYSEMSFSSRPTIEVLRK
jgi:hypothetical protein